MEQTTSFPHLVKSLIADARHGRRSTLFSICQVDSCGKCEVHEQLPDGACRVWPESFSERQQAEGAIFLQGPERE